MYRFERFEYKLEYKCGKYYVIFWDFDGQFHKLEVDEVLYLEMVQFRKEHKRQENFFDRHIEKHALTDEQFLERSVRKQKSIEELMHEKEIADKLYKAIEGLPEIQRRRFLLYYVEGLAYTKIAELEKCSRRAVAYSVSIAKEKVMREILSFL